MIPSRWLLPVTGLAANRPSLANWTKYVEQDELFWAPFLYNSKTLLIRQCLIDILGWLPIFVPVSLYCTNLIQAASASTNIWRQPRMSIDRSMHAQDFTMETRQKRFLTKELLSEPKRHISSRLMSTGLIKCNKFSIHFGENLSAVKWLNSGFYYELKELRRPVTTLRWFKFKCCREFWKMKYLSRRDTSPSLGGTRGDTAA